MFRTSRGLLLSSSIETDEVLATLHILPLLIASPHTDPATAAVSSRLLLSLLLYLPQTPVSLVSLDPTAHERILDQVVWACETTILHDASNPWLRRGLALFAQAIGQDGNGHASYGLYGLYGRMQAMKTLSLLIHPHLPPLLRNIASLDNVPIYKTEGKEEREVREGMGLVSLDDKTGALVEDANVTLVSYKPPGVNGDNYLPSQSMSIDPEPSKPVVTGSVPPNASNSLSTAFSSGLGVSTFSAQSSFQETPPPSTPSAMPVAPPSSLFKISGPSQQPQQPQSAPQPQTTNIVSSGGEEDSDDEPLPDIDMGEDSD